MTRSIGASVLAEIQAERATPGFLLEAEFTDSGGNQSFVRVATTSQDVDVTLDDGRTETFTGAGEFLSWSGVREDVERARSRVRLQLSAVDTTIVSTLMSNNFRGHEIRLWIAFWNDATGAQIGSAYPLFEGFQLGDYEVPEQWGDESQAGTATIETTVESFATVNRRVMVATNTSSHNQYLKRLGLPTGDEFFRFIPELVSKEVYWGRNFPDSSLSPEGYRKGRDSESGGRKAVPR